MKNGNICVEKMAVNLLILNNINSSDPEIIRGAQPFPAFQSVIEKKLDELKK